MDESHQRASRSKDVNWPMLPTNLAFKVENVRLKTSLKPDMHLNLFSEQNKSCNFRWKLALILLCRQQVSWCNVSISGYH